MTDGVDQWIESAIPPGSGRYYALLHSDSAMQEKQRLLTTIISIFSKLGFQSREIEVVKHKLAWWRHELEKENFDHPVMVAFGDKTLPAATRNQLIRLLNGYGSLLESGSPSTDEQNARFHLDTGATACHLLCNDDNEVVTKAGVVLSRFRCFRYLRQHVDNGLLCLPMSSLDEAKVSPALLTPAACDENVKSYLAKELEMLQQEFIDCTQALESRLKSLQPAQYQHCKALYIYLSLQGKLLQSIRKDELSVVEQVSRLTPIRNYWYAFRAARNFDKLG